MRRGDRASRARPGRAAGRAPATARRRPPRTRPRRHRARSVGRRAGSAGEGAWPRRVLRVRSGSGRHRRPPGRERPSRDGSGTVGARLRPGHCFGAPLSAPGSALDRRACPPPRSAGGGPDPRSRGGPAGRADLPRGGRPPGDLDPDLGRADAHDHRPGDRGSRRRGLLGLPRGPRRLRAHARRDERARPRPDRRRAPADGRRDHRPGRPDPAATGQPQRAARPALRLAPGPRRAALDLDVLGAAHLERRRRRRPQRPDGSPPGVPPERRPLPRDARGAARRDRRERPTAGRGRGPGRQPAGDRRGPGEPRHGRDPRAADAAGRRPGEPRAHRRPAARDGGVERTATAGSTEALRQVDRLDAMVDSILASLRVLREEPPALDPSTSRRWSTRSWSRSGRSSAATSSTRPSPSGRSLAVGLDRPPRAAARVPPRERRQVRPGRRPDRAAAAGAMAAGCCSR